MCRFRSRFATVCDGEVVLCWCSTMTVWWCMLNVDDDDVNEDYYHYFLPVSQFVHHYGRSLPNSCSFIKYSEWYKHLCDRWNRWCWPNIWNLEFYIKCIYFSVNKFYEKLYLYGVPWNDGFSSKIIRYVFWEKLYYRISPQSVGNFYTIIRTS